MLALSVAGAAVLAGCNSSDAGNDENPTEDGPPVVIRDIEAIRDQVIVATKCGMNWDDAGNVRFDSRPERLRQEVEDSLRRLQTDTIDILQFDGGDAQTLQQAGFTCHLVKVLNKSTVTRSLRIMSPQSGPVYAGAAEEEGVIGGISGASLHRFPSSIYWNGLALWGIRRNRCNYAADQLEAFG